MGAHQTIEIPDWVPADLKGKVRKELAAETIGLKQVLALLDGGKVTERELLSDHRIGLSINRAFIFESDLQFNTDTTRQIDPFNVENQPNRVWRLRRWLNETHLGRKSWGEPMQRMSGGGF